MLKASNGADGVALARQDKPDAVLMDIVMPGMNGFQATRQLSKDPETSAIPVIVVTTKDQETDRIWATRQGARDFLTKPVEEDALIAKLKEVLGATACNSGAASAFALPGNGSSRPWARWPRCCANRAAAASPACSRGCAG
ncbi:Response regulator PleD [compost metagenome]